MTSYAMLRAAGLVPDVTVTRNAEPVTRNRQPVAPVTPVTDNVTTVTESVTPVTVTRAEYEALVARVAALEVRGAHEAPADDAGKAPRPSRGDGSRASYMRAYRARKRDAGGLG